MHAGVRCGDLDCCNTHLWALRAMRKTCSTCGVEKDANRSKSSQFSTMGNRYRPNCKACVNARERKRQNHHKALAKRELRKVKEREAVGLNPHGFLAAAVLSTAIREHRNWSNGVMKAKVDYGIAMTMAREDGFNDPVEAIEDFFESSWFDELCGMCNSEPEYIRKHIGT